jgi:hypothetical protein
MSKILYIDTDGTKGSLPAGTLGYDAYAAGGDEGRVAVGTASGTDVLLAKKSEIDDEVARAVAAEGVLATNKQDVLVSGTSIKTINGLSLLGSGNLIIGGSLAAPEITITTTANENGSVVGTIDNYVAGVTYYVAAANGLINGGLGVQVVSASTFTYTAPDVTDGDDDADTITAYYMFESSLSESTIINMTISYLPVVADTAVTFTFATDTENNGGFSA